METTIMGVIGYIMGLYCCCQALKVLGKKKPESWVSSLSFRAWGLGTWILKIGARSFGLMVES